MREWRTFAAAVFCPLGLHWWSEWNAYGRRYCVNCQVGQMRL